MPTIATVPAFFEVSSLGAYLESAGVLERAGVVAIDGYNGTGKTCAARALAQVLGIAAIHGDDYIWNQGTKLYPTLLDLRTLEKTLRSHTSLGHSVILDSVHVASVLDAINRPPIEYVYVNHYWPASTATHSGLLEPAPVLSARIAEEVVEHEVQGRDPDEDPTLFLELLRYHQNLRPLSRRTVELHLIFPSR